MNGPLVWHCSAMPASATIPKFDYQVLLSNNFEHMKEKCVNNWDKENSRKVIQLYNLYAQLIFVGGEVCLIYIFLTCSPLILQQVSITRLAHVPVSLKPVAGLGPMKSRDSCCSTTGLLLVTTLSTFIQTRKNLVFVLFSCSLPI